MALFAQSRPEDAAWDVVITPSRGLLDLGLHDVWRYRDLIKIFVRRNFVIYYRQTVLGPIWYVVQPLTTTGVFFVIFGLLARIPTDQIAPSLFYLSGVVMWSNFSSNVLMTSDVFNINMNVFGKVYFPRLVIPIATILTNCVSLFLQLAVFVAVYAFQIIANHAPPPTIWCVFALLLFAANAIMAFGFGLMLSALTTRYRDVIPVLGFGIQLWMYATPVIYPLSQLPERWRLVAALNPVTTTIESFRLLVFGTGSVSMLQMVISSIVGASVVLAGLVMFNRRALTAVDTI